MARSRHKHVHRRRAPHRRLARVGLATSAVLAAASPVAAVVWSDELSSFVSPEVTTAAQGRARSAPAPIRGAFPQADDLVMLADRRPDVRPDGSAKDEPARDARPGDSRADAVGGRRQAAARRPGGSPPSATPTSGPARAVATTTATAGPSPTGTAMRTAASTSPSWSTSTTTQLSSTQPTTQPTAQPTAAPTSLPTGTATDQATTEDTAAPKRPKGAACPPQGKGSSSAGCTTSLP